MHDIDKRDGLQALIDNAFEKTGFDGTTKKADIGVVANESGKPDCSVNRAADGRDQT
jgi:hypothetical protein